MEYLRYVLPWVTLIQEAMVLTRLEQEKLVDLSDLLLVVTKTPLHSINFNRKQLIAEKV